MWKRCSGHMRNTEPSIPGPGKAARALALLLSTALLLAGCAEELEPENTPTPAPLLATTPAPVPAQGGQLLMPIPINPFTRDDDVPPALDALAVTTEEMRNFYTLLYEPLLRCDNTNRLTPSLAERWSVDESGLIWTIELRAGVYWHGGNTLNAGDVIYTMEQIRSLGEKSCYYAALDGAALSWERVDDLTLKITMKQKGMQSLYALTFPVLPAQGGDVAGLPVNGTGPYRISRYVDSPSNSYVDLAINESWWKQRPYLDSVRCYSRENNSVALDSYEAGILNMVLTDSISAGKYREEGITVVQDLMTQDAEMLLINHRNGILSSRDVRRAIAFALNRSAIISNVYMNRAAVSDVPVPPDSFLYSPASKIYDHNAAEADAILTAAGWIDMNGDGIRERQGQRLSLRLLVNESTENGYRKSAAAMVEAQLEAAGFSIEIETAKYKLGESESEFETRLASGDYDLAMAGFSVPESGDLSAYLLGSGACHFTGYVSAGLTEAVNRAAAAGDETAMREAHEALQLAFVEELPFVMLYFRLNSLVYSTRIQGVADVREPDALRTMERWYIETQQ